MDKTQAWVKTLIKILNKMMAEVWPVWTSIQLITTLQTFNKYTIQLVLVPWPKLLPLEPVTMVLVQVLEVSIVDPLHLQL